MMHARTNTLDTLLACEDVAGQRALAEFRSGRPVMLLADDSVIAVPVDGCDRQFLQALRQTADVGPLRLAITARRALALGFETTGAIAVNVSARVEIEELISIAAGVLAERSLDAFPAGPAILAGIDLAKLAGRLPSVLVAQIRSADKLGAIAQVKAATVSRLRQQLTQSLQMATSSSIPLENTDSARLVVFRDAVGSSPAALVIGNPNLSNPVLVRLHSACLTGDAIGSQRCDCGDQLKLAISRMRTSGGILLYLDQEGRGLGLLNKIRAYRLQDSGLDTLDANMALGFEDDERDYRIAARMLQLLGCKRVVLLTNNPTKITALSRAGIEICGRAPILAALTTKNCRYLTTMATRAGHYLEAGDGLIRS